MIDLSVSWNTTNPVFKALTCGPAGSSMPSTLSSDGKSWFVLSNNHTGFLYNMKSKTWNKTLTLKDRRNHKIHKSTAVTDPATGLIYIIESLLPKRHDFHNIRTVNLATNTADKLKLSTTTRELVSSTVTWSKSRNSMLSLFGRRKSNSRLAAFDPTTGWSTLTTTGDIPPMRTNGCFVSANGGTSAIYFGGFGYGQGGFHDIYVLNVTTLVWKRGPNLSKANRRGGASCAVSNNQFIAWGGFNSMNPKLPDSTLVYDLITHQWTPSYIASPSSLNKSSSPSSETPTATAPIVSSTPVAIETSTTTSPATTSSISSSNTQSALKANPQSNNSRGHTVVIVVAVIAAILVLLAIAGLIFCLRKRSIRRNARTMDGDILYNPSLASTTAINPMKSEIPAEPDQQRHFVTINNDPEPRSNLNFNPMPTAADPPQPPRDDLESPASSSDDDDDKSTLNESTPRQSKALDDSYWSIVLSMEQQQQKHRRRESDDSASTITSALTPPLLQNAEIFAFPLPPSPNTTTLDAIQQHKEKHGHGHFYDHNLGITNTTATMKNIIASASNNYDNDNDYDYDYDYDSDCSKRHSHIGMKYVKSESNDILEICYFPRPISHHATLRDVYDTLAAPPPVPIPVPNVDYGYI
ncbi:hypothetical protein BGZ80_001500 [Entomortierella chlamydospora]|uniref:Galactose oxidase n=1 Tax=Entomortierella chlamydospora TaxID=101097 RepID=A0A9P6SXQ8_9FUNG|nr:hypothetical protein BGZ80_001500 [Entomortierella chlamydospora]